jgi:nicotinamidase/pyrazinamidase
MAITIQPTDALILVDVQNDFCPPHDGIGGALAVPDGDAVIPILNSLVPHFAHIIATQDWHPAGHISFQPTGPWPPHCVQNTKGAELHPDLRLPASTYIQKKGMQPQLDSYSAFIENDRTTRTGLTDHLRSLGIQRVFVTGLAYDYCVAFTARDARSEGFQVVVIEDACRGIAEKTCSEANSHFAAEHITRIPASDIL